MNDNNELSWDYDALLSCQVTSVVRAFCLTAIYVMCDTSLYGDAICVRSDKQ